MIHQYRFTICFFLSSHTYPYMTPTHDMYISDPRYHISTTSKLILPFFYLTTHPTPFN
uniref:Uncharacterized protein n=1 Tax=Octopus bimaculoides TaxID=37653 RepID=A0A0L8GXD3_OCTBM